MSKVLIHIGYPKAGSSYLQAWFARNPSTVYRTRAIAGFYDAHDLCRYAQSRDTPQEYFVLSCEDLSVWKGEVEDAGDDGKPYDIEKYHHNMSTMLHDIFPTAKLLIVTRGYSSMLVSLYSQYVKGGGVLGFAEMQKHFSGFFPILYNYTWLIELYRKVFDNENVIVMPFELLRDDPCKFTEVLEDKLGLNERFQYTTAKVNPSLERKSITAYRQYSQFIYFLIKIFPGSLRRKLFKRHLRQLAKKEKHFIIDLLTQFAKEEEELNVDSAILESLRGKAEVLRHEELFQPYLKEYLL